MVTRRLLEKEVIEGEELQELIAQSAAFGKPHETRVAREFLVSV